MAIANITGNILTDTGVAISSLVSGSGTTNYLPKFTGSTTIGNSLIFDDGSGIGIGTTTPNYLLQINSSTTAAHLQLTNSTTGSTINDGARLLISGLNMTLGNREAGFISFETTDSERMRISATGLVGIGTTSAAARLDVRVPVESPATGAVALIAGTSNGANDIFRWFDGTTQLGVFKNNGNVGIGTSSPGDRLTIATGASTSAAVTFWANAGTSANELYVGQGSSNEAYVFNRANQHLVLGTNNTERMRITSGGRVQAPFGYQSFNGSVSIGAGATTTIYTMAQASAADGVYYVYCRLNGGAAIYMASAIVTALAANNELFISNTRTGANVGLSVSGRDIRITNGGFATFTWQWSILFQPVD